MTEISNKEEEIRLPLNQSVEPSFDLYCIHCGFYRAHGGGRFCPNCGKECGVQSTNEQVVDATSATATTPVVPEKPAAPKRQKDVIHCTVCHLPKAGHICSQVPCLDPNACGKQRLHRRQGNRGYHDTISFLAHSANGQAYTVTSLSPAPITAAVNTSPLPLADNNTVNNNETSPITPIGKRPRTDSGLFRSIETHLNPDRREEVERAKEFIHALGSFFLTYEPSLDCDEGRLICLKIASSTHTQLQAAYRKLKRSKKRPSDGSGGVSDNANDNNSQPSFADSQHAVNEQMNAEQDHPLDHASADSHPITVQDHMEGVHHQLDSQAVHANGDEETVIEYSSEYREKDEPSVPAASEEIGV